MQTLMSSKMHTRRALSIGAVLACGLILQPVQAQVLTDPNGDETVPPGTEVQIPLPQPNNGPTATLPGQDDGRTVVTIENGGTTAPGQQDLPTGAEPVTQNERNQRIQPAEQAVPTPTGDFPIIGAQDLLNSLDELDRPLTPEEITAYPSDRHTRLKREQQRQYR